MSIIVPRDNLFDTFYIIDFDRTLVDSDTLLEIFISVASQYGDISYEQIKKIDIDKKSKGISFDAAEYVHEALSKSGSFAQWSQLEQHYRWECRARSVLMPGAAQLLDSLQVSTRQYGILTYGDPMWQKLKLSASGLGRVPRIVTTQKTKGGLIAGWQNDDNLFELPDEFGGGLATRIILIDDKAMSFEGFPGEPSRGYHVMDNKTALPAQRGVVPHNVMQVASLYEVIKLL